MLDNINAANVLLPELVSRNKDAADRFIDANIAAHPELQEIYNQAVNNAQGKTL